MYLDSVLDEPQSGIQPSRRLIFFDHAQLDQLDVLAGEIDGGFDQLPPDTGPSRTGPDIHPD
jgi:hypothetical protein